MSINTVKGGNSPGRKGAESVFLGLGFHLFLKSSNVIPQMVGSGIAICWELGVGGFKSTRDFRDSFFS